ncbi:hypothetical protein U472_16015 [Orenia metallireducens]|jgi:hypothetical protein|uniref:Uncharacterized protein n=1 Tax=Orenia metallireducens TaxID=1413210 RepID=A0A1C0A4Q6_9FIRM|nr:hypothetical protein [Orenia metallireducens]OCL24955.1 hypothetical protein U472_16015 [Orenia metallireducens]
MENFEVKETEIRENKDNNLNNQTKQDLFNNDFLLLLLILFVFFGNTEVFSDHFNFLNGQVKQVKNLLDIADATIQALNQASQIPHQMLK